MPKVLLVGFSSRVFPDIDQRDAQVAMELWARELSRKSGIPAAQVTIFHDTAMLRKAVQRGMLHIVTMSAIEYLKVRDEISLNPAFVASTRVGRNMDQLLIVHRDSGIRKVKDLRDKSFAMLPSAKLEVARIWVNVLLRRNGIREGSACFCRVKEYTKASKAIMGVFFRQADATVVSRGTFETCRALNPQLGEELVILAESPSLMGNITCLSLSISAPFRSAIENAALHLHENSVGKQILTLFQIDRVIRFKGADLAGVEELLAEQARMRRKED